ncbi:MAG: type VI secretion system tip protein VgrG [Gammaproteobacteria bacterium]|nr:type VI secretion system tip protein VgrG [Gammaproteobacteria bacterium]
MLMDEGSSSSAISDSLQEQQRNPADTSQFTFDLIGSHEELRVVSFTGTESVSQAFKYHVTIASRNDLLIAEQFMGKSARLTLVDAQQNELVHGEIACFSQVSEQGDYLLYELLMVPRFWFLKKRHNHRIFQNLSVIQIIEQVLSGAGISTDHYALRLSQNYLPKTYCVQYDESEFDFLSRLMEEEGLHYHFEHLPERHLMVIADHPAAFPDIQGSPQLPYHPKDGLNQVFNNIYEFRFQFQTRYGTASTRDYSFKKPLNPIQDRQYAMEPHLEDYSYPGNYQDSSDAQRKTRIKLQQHQHKLEQGFAKSNCRHLRAGRYYQLFDNPGRRHNQQYLLLFVEHKGEQPQSLDEYGAGAHSKYHNTSRCIPAATAYKTPQLHKKSIISGYQSSTVSGPSGEEIYTNEHAQSKVQFPWDREAQQDENSSCWLRAAQTWAGKNWGSLILPRMGQEAKVGYIHGDPDRPVITGQLYNERHKPPYTLPKHKTRSTFKTSSSLGGKGYNEIRIDDRKNQEQVYFHAQKDLDIRAKNDRRDIINHDRHLIVDNNRYEHIKDNSHHSIGHNQNEKTGQDHSISIGQTQHCQAGQAVLTEVAQSIHFKAGQKIILEAGVELTIKAGGGFIKIDPSGITAQGAAINFNSGTGAGSATIASPQQAFIAVEADRDKPGQTFIPTAPQAVKTAEKIGFKGEISRLLQAGNDNEQGICIPCLL